MASKLAVRLAVIGISWTLSATVILFLVPFLCIFWTWSLVTDYSHTVKHKKTGSKIASRNLRGWGTSRFVQLKDVNIHYVEAGDQSAPLMLCLHGFPEFWFSWRHQLKEFSSTHRVVAVDLRGYGDSDKPNGRDAYKLDRLVDDVRQIIEILGKGKCDVLLAHDWGGGIGWELVIQHPEMVGRFIPMNCPHQAAFISVFLTDYKQILRSWYMIFFQLPVIPEKVLMAFGGSFFRWMCQRRHFAVHRGQYGEQERKAYRDLYQHSRDLTGPINFYRSMIDPDTMGKPPQIVKVPTLLIWGSQDHALGVDMAHQSARWVENFTLALIPEATHWVQQDAPDSVNQKIRAFLEK